MNKEEILLAFLKAKKHWGRSLLWCNIYRYNYTYLGFCSYFYRQGYSYEDIDLYLKPLWVEFKTIEYPKGGVKPLLDFNGLGCLKKGRTERLLAINKIIKKLK